MRILIIGCGLVGKALARELKLDGHTVVGTTTSPEKVKTLRAICDEVVVLHGHDAARVQYAAQDCDGIVVCVRPPARHAMTAGERKKPSHRVLVETASSAVSAPIDGPVVSLSSFAVYGDADYHLDQIDEAAPLTSAQDARTACLREAEEIYRSQAPSRHVIFRCSDIAGRDDPSIETTLHPAHQDFGGHVPSQEQALFYRVHQQDVVLAIKHALQAGLVGTFSLDHSKITPRNDEHFSAVCDLPRMTFSDELKTPNKPASADRLPETGFRPPHTEADQRPALF